jgi:hypothetical protein
MQSLTLLDVSFNKMKVQRMSLLSEIQSLTSLDVSYDSIRNYDEVREIFDHIRNDRNTENQSLKQQLYCHQNNIPLFHNNDYNRIVL